jgi:ABC-type tungstate transport system substrate-binding protein
MALALSTLLGAPAGYALARFGFRGRDSFQLLILTTRAFPIAILGMPLTVTFINWNLYDTLWAVALVHTALALPTAVRLRVRRQLYRQSADEFSPRHRACNRRNCAGRHRCAISDSPEFAWAIWRSARRHPRREYPTCRLASLG